MRGGSNHLHVLINVRLAHPHSCELEKPLGISLHKIPSPYSTFNCCCFFDSHLSGGCRLLSRSGPTPPPGNDQTILRAVAPAHVSAMTQHNSTRQRNTQATRLTARNAGRSFHFSDSSDTGLDSNPAWSSSKALAPADENAMRTVLLEFFRPQRCWNCRKLAFSHKTRPTSVIVNCIINYYYDGSY